MTATLRAPDPRTPPTDPSPGSRPAPDRDHGRASRAIDRLPSPAFISGSFDPGHCGVSHYTARLGEALRDRGFRPIVLTDSTIDRGKQPLPWAAIVDDWSLGQLDRFARRLRRLGPDILHVQFAPLSYPAGRRTLRLLPAMLRLRGWDGRLVVTLHEYTAPEHADGIAARLRRRAASAIGWDADIGLLAPAADAVIVTNERHRTDLVAAHPDLAGRVHLVPLAANLAVAPSPSPERRAELRADYGLPQAGPLVVFFGFVHPVKGLEHLVRAVSQLIRDRPDLGVVVAGGWESLALSGAEAEDYIGQLRGLVGELGLERVVRFTGHLDDRTASQLLSMADVGAVPLTYGASLKSGSLLAMLEHGLPVVTTRAEPPSPALRDGENVLLVPPRDADALAAAIERLLADRTLASSVAEAGSRLAAEHSWPGIAEAHEAIYRSVMPESSARR